MSKILAIAVKNLKEAVRQPKNLGLTLGLPVVFMLIFGAAFGAGEENETFTLAVVNEDGAAMSVQYVAGLGNLTYEDGAPVLATTAFTNVAEATQVVEARQFDGLLIVPSNFSQQAAPSQRPVNGGPLGAQQGVERVPPDGATVTVTGDPTFVDYTAVARIVAAYTERFNAAITGESPPVSVDQTFVASQQLTAFDRIAPGLMIFAVLNIVPQAASMLARESELKTLDRFRQSPSRAVHLLGGVMLAQLVLASVSVFLMFGAARVMGFHNQGSYVVAYVIALTAAFAVVGIGMIVAAFARSQQEAANLGTVIAVPASFLSGAFFAIPSVHLFTWGSRDIGLYDFLPTTHAVTALRDVLTYGRGLDAVAGGAVVMAGLAFLYLLVGIVLYRRGRLAPS